MTNEHEVISGVKDRLTTIGLTSAFCLETNVFAVGFDDSEPPPTASACVTVGYGAGNWTGFVGTITVRVSVWRRAEADQPGEAETQLSDGTPQGVLYALTQITRALHNSFLDGVLISPLRIRSSSSVRIIEGPDGAWITGYRDFEAGIDLGLPEPAAGNSGFGSSTQGGDLGG